MLETNSFFPLILDALSFAHMYGMPGFSKENMFKNMFKCGAELPQKLAVYDTHWKKRVAGNVLIGVYTLISTNICNFNVKNSYNRKFYP